MQAIGQLQFELTFSCLHYADTEPQQHMQWVTKHLVASSEATKPQISAASSPPALMKTARLSGPMSGDAFAFTLSKMKLDGFTGVVVSISPEDWRLQRHIIVSPDYPHPSRKCTPHMITSRRATCRGPIAALSCSITRCYHPFFSRSITRCYHSCPTSGSLSSRSCAIRHTASAPLTAALRFAASSLRDPIFKCTSFPYCHTPSSRP
jgi:hypothetical protein